MGRSTIEAKFQQMCFNTLYDTQTSTGWECQAVDRQTAGSAPEMKQ